jgi:glutathione S-transferase
MFTIYGVPLSIHVRKVIVTALEKRLEHRVEAVFPFDPPAGWRELSPTGKIPALKHGDLTLADSSVIVAYLEKRFAEHPLTPSEPAQYARALWFEEYVDSQVAPDVIALFKQKVLGPMVHEIETDATVVDRLLHEELPPKLDYLEASLQGDYFVGGRVSIADITLASDLTVPLSGPAARRRALSETDCTLPAHAETGVVPECIGGRTALRGENGARSQLPVAAGRVVPRQGRRCAQDR